MTPEADSAMNKSAIDPSTSNLQVRHPDMEPHANLPPTGAPRPNGFSIRTRYKAGHERRTSELTGELR